jgi:hypothetical protein
VLLVEVEGECGGQWLLSRQTDSWSLVKESPAQPAARVTIPQEIAWRVFTKGIDRDSAREQIKMEGDPRLANRVLDLTAIVG